MPKTPMILARLLAAAVILSIGAAGPAAATGPLAKPGLSGPGGGPCSAVIAAAEDREGIPDHLLAAISRAESGRTDPETGEIVAWPWTLNAGGEGFYFATKAEAVAKVRELRAKGITSIDVGCMQVNLHHHPDAFDSLDEAFEPGANVAYAAAFLKDLREANHSWARAVALYHSATREFNYPYRRRVYQLWGQIRREDARRKREEVLQAYNERRAAAEAKRKAGRDPS